MERNELVLGIKNALDEVTKAIVSAMNELRMSMNERIAIITREKRELAEDNETLANISVAVSDFIEDMTEVAVNMENVTAVVDDILYDLDDIPDEIVVEDEDELDFADEDFHEDNEVDEDKPAENAD